MKGTEWYRKDRESMNQNIVDLPKDKTVPKPSVLASRGIGSTFASVRLAG